MTDPLPAQNDSLSTATTEELVYELVARYDRLVVILEPMDKASQARMGKIMWAYNGGPTVALGLMDRFKSAILQVELAPPGPGETGDLVT